MTRRILLSVLLAYPGLASAGGQFVGDNGSQGMQRAGAFAVKADDPTALYYNPAGLARITSNQFFLGVNLVHMDMTYERTGAYAERTGGPQADYIGEPYPRVRHEGEPQPVPFVAAALPARSYTLAFGLFAPHGYGRRNFPETVITQTGLEAPAPQRYDTVSQQAVVAMPSVAVAFELGDGLRVGVRASYVYASTVSVKYAQGVPDAAESPGRDTRAVLSAKDTSSYAFGVGLHYLLGEDVELGATYSSAVAIHAVGTSSTTMGSDLEALDTRVLPVPDAEARCAPGGQEGALSACLDFALPQTATVGLRWVNRDARGEELADVELDVKWENWSAVSDYRVVIDGMNTTVMQPLNDTVVRHGFKDSYSVRLGASSTMRRGDSRWVFRGGLGYDTESAPASWTRLDVDVSERFTVAGGFGVFVGDWRLDVGAAYIESPRQFVRDEIVADTADMDARVQPDVAVPLSAPDAQPYHPFNAGVYWTHYLVGSVGLTKAW